MRFPWGRAVPVQLELDSLGDGRLPVHLEVVDEVPAKRLPFGTSTHRAPKLPPNNSPASFTRELRG